MADEFIPNEEAVSDAPEMYDEDDGDITGEFEESDIVCPICSGNMIKEMDRNQSYIYTCKDCGHTESE
jgi:predicted RNA-binding Zn-ribbon protein involved in translation (DUF1610 family)